MPSFFSSLEVGKRAIMAHQRALETVGHNIANATTPGFSRQEVVFRAAAAYAPPSMAGDGGAGQLGTGVEVAEVRRYRDGFLDRQVRTETNSLGYWEAREGVFGEIEGIVAEPSDRGLRAELSLFWSAWQDVANHPELQGARAAMRQRGASLAASFRQEYGQLLELRKNLDARVRAAAGEINTIAQQIADLNAQIIRASSSGDRPNDLRDQRDLLIDELSKLVDIQFGEDSRASVNIFVNGVELVSGDRAKPIQINDDPLNNNFATLYWSQAAAPVAINSGELKARLEMRDQVIPQLLTDLQAVATTIVAQVNALHAAGVGLNGSTGNNFFEMPLDVMSMDVSAAVKADLKNIAAAKAGVPPDPLGVYLPGDGRNALDIANLRNQNLIGGATIDDFYHGVVSKLGVDAQEAARLTENQKSLVAFVENQRQAIVGVNLDEEMTRMIQLEQGYRAAARFINAIDQALESVLTMGLVGR